MAKYNTKKEPVKPTEVNEMGEHAYKLEAKEELVAICLTTFVQKSYYESEDAIVKRILETSSKVNPEFVAKLAVYLRTEANMRSVSHVLAGSLASRLSGNDIAKRFYEKIIVRPDDMSEILGFYFSSPFSEKNSGGKSKIPNAIKKGFRSKLTKLDAYQIDKYKMSNREISLVDLVNLFKPHPTTANTEAFRRLMKGESLEGLYSSKILEKEMSKAGRIAAESSSISVEEAKEEAIETVLKNVTGMPIFNLVRNLRNILLLAPGSVAEACTQLTTKNKILNSRLLPFRFATAYNEINDVRDMPSTSKTRTSIPFESDKASANSFAELKAQILKALETALEYSIANIPELEGNTAILVDHSGSVRGDGGGSGRVSAFGKTTSAMIGNLFGSMLAYRQDNVYIGLFGDRLINIPIDRKKGVLHFNDDSFTKGNACGGGTENGLYIFLNQCIIEKKKVDNLVIFSDMVIGDGGKGGWDGTSRAGLGSFQELFKRFKQVNPQCVTICVDIHQTSGKSVFDKSLNVLQIAGWSDKIFDVIKNNCKGYKAIIDEIEKIVI